MQKLFIGNELKLNFKGEIYGTSKRKELQRKNRQRLCCG